MAYWVNTLNMLIYLNFDNLTLQQSSHPPYDSECSADSTENLKEIRMTDELAAAFLYPPKIWL